MSKSMNCRPVWLSSWPRSGNTLLRTILWQCFGLRSSSVYPNDLANNAELEKQVGHIEHDGRGGVRFPPGNPPLIKTHEYPPDDSPAIYVVRDGRAACISLWNFYARKISLVDVITGNHRFGKWSDHIQAWMPWDRKMTLMLKYEALVSHRKDDSLEKISEFLGRSIISREMPDRDKMASIEGRWIRNMRKNEERLDDNLLRMFRKYNGVIFERLGYEY